MSAVDFALILGLVAGALLVQRGLMGRSFLSRPRCAKCKHELHVLDPEESPNCPECGAHLSAPDAVLFGRTRRRRWVLRIGVALLALSVLVLGARFGQRWTGLRWSRIRPASWVVRDIDRPDRRSAAFGELSRRYEAGELSDEMLAASVDRVIALVRSGAVKSKDSLYRAGFVHDGIHQSRLEPAQLERLAAALVEPIVVQMHERGRRDAWVSFEIASAHPRFGGLGLQRLHALRSVKDPEGRVLPVRELTGSPGMLSTGWNQLVGEVRCALPEGRQLLDFELEVGVSYNEDVWALRDPGEPETWPAVLHQWRTTVTHAIEVVGEDAVAIETIDDPALEPKVRAAVDIGLKIRGTPGAPVVALELGIERRTGMTLAFDVLLRVEGTEHRLGWYRIDEGGRSRTPLVKSVADLGGTLAARAAGGAGQGRYRESADVILRPNPDLLDQVAGAPPLWNRELVFEDVGVIEVRSD